MTGKTRWSLTTPNAVLDVLLLGGALFVGFLGAHHIYQTPWFYANVGVGLALGVAIAGASTILRWRGWVTALVVAGTYVIGATLLRGPGNLFSPAYLARRFLGVITTPVTGWRDLLTLDIPLGSYHQVLAPVFLIAISISAGAFLLTWHSKRWWPVAAGLSFVPLLFGILFGSSRPASPLTWIPTELSDWALGVATLMVSFAWLVWRRQAQKRGARTEVRDAAGEAIRGRWVAAKITRITLGALMVTAAVALSAVVSPHVMDPNKRDVLRTNVDPTVHLQEQVSPLSALREYYGDKNYAKPLFSFSSDGSTPRIRLATLTAYDGNMFYPAGTIDGETFTRVPSRLLPIDSLEQQLPPVDVEMSIDAYEGVWMPLPGALDSIEFQGARRESLADGFFYNQDTQTGLQISREGLLPETSYLTRVVPEKPLNVASFKPGGGVGFGVEAPDSLREWVDAQELGRDGQSLLTLIERLRERGYLSHDLLISGSDPLWVDALPGYTFEPSRSGHSLDRIDQLFVKLLERQQTASGEASQTSLVSAVGDDEQFVVASALIATELGFDSRVVLGFRTEADQGDSTLSHCGDGICMGGDISAWLEVRDANTNAWAPIDVTPQSTQRPDPKQQKQSDPEHHTSVDPETIVTLPPPQAEPSTSAAQEQNPARRDGQSAAASPLVKVGLIAGFGLLLTVWPFLLIVGLKTIRTTRRKRAPWAGSRVLGAWEQYVDAGLDSGFQSPSGGTRTDTVMLWSQGDPWARAVADTADRSTFGPRTDLEFDTDPTWEAADAAVKNLLVQQTTFQKLRSKLSLRSLIRWKDRPR